MGGGGGASYSATPDLRNTKANGINRNAHTHTHLESENAATPLGSESIPAPITFFTKLNTDCDMLDLSASPVSIA